MSDNAPIDPRLDRYRPLSVALSRALVLAAALAVAALIVPGPAGRYLGEALVAILIAAPLLRVAWFVVRWFRRGDPRFAMVGVGVLSVISIGLVIALVGA